MVRALLQSPAGTQFNSRSLTFRKASPMNCPFCRHDDSRVVDSRPADDGSLIRRRRECLECGRRFTTSETSVLLVIKRSGATEPFSREKVISGVRKACQGRPVNDDDYALLAQRVEEALRLVDALQFFEENGEVCPANWHKGDQGLKATQDGIKNYLGKH